MEVKRHEEFSLKDSNIFLKFFLTGSENDLNNASLVVFEFEHEHEKIRKKLAVILNTTEEPNILASGAFTRPNRKWKFEACIGSDSLIQKKGKHKRETVKEVEEIITKTFNDFLSTPPLPQTETLNHHCKSGY